jgi:hypothetical protein
MSILNKKRTSLIERCGKPGRVARDRESWIVDSNPNYSQRDYPIFIVSPTGTKLTMADSENERRMNQKITIVRNTLTMKGEGIVLRPKIGEDEVELERLETLLDLLHGNAQTPIVDLTPDNSNFKVTTGGDVIPNCRRWVEDFGQLILVPKSISDQAPNGTFASPSAVNGFGTGTSPRSFVIWNDEMNSGLFHAFRRATGASGVPANELGRDLPPPPRETCRTFSNYLTYSDRTPVYTAIPEAYPMSRLEIDFHGSVGTHFNHDYRLTTADAPFLIQAIEQTTWLGWHPAGAHNSDGSQLLRPKWFPAGIVGYRFHDTLRGGFGDAVIRGHRSLRQKRSIAFLLLRNHLRTTYGCDPSGHISAALNSQESNAFPAIAECINNLIYHLSQQASGEDPGMLFHHLLDYVTGLICGQVLYFQDLGKARHKVLAFNTSFLIFCLRGCFPAFIHRIISDVLEESIAVLNSNGFNQEADYLRRTND